MHRECQLKLRPQQHLPSIKLAQLCEYPQLQRRVNSQQYELSGIHNLIVQLKKQTIQQLKQEFISNNNVNLHQFMWLISNSVMRTSMRVGLRSNHIINNNSNNRDKQKNRSKIQGNTINNDSIIQNSTINAQQNMINSIINNASLQSQLDDEYYRYQIQYQIVKVFQQIDIDNSNSISWQQYIQYITSSSLMEITQNNGIGQGQLSALNMDDRKIKEVGFVYKEKTLFRKNGIRKIVQVQRLGMLAIVQKKSDLLTFININGNLLSKPYQLNGIDHNKVLSIDYSEDQRIFGVLLSSHMVMFVQDGEIPKVNVDNRFTGDQVQIMYLRQHKLWLLSSLDYTIQIFTPDKGRKKQQQKQRTIIRFKPHAQQLIAIKQLHNPLSILTASYKNSIKIWSLTLNQLLIQLNPGNQDGFTQCKSIKGVQVYNHHLTSYMICWMFSPEISVWLPSSSLTKPYLGKLKGHVGIVQQAKFLTNFPTVVSIDNKGSVRVWDLMKMQCVQAWKMEQKINIQISVLRSLPYVLFYDKLIQYYKSNKQCNLIQYNSQKKSALAIPGQEKFSANKNNTKIKLQIQRKGSSSMPQSSKLIQSNKQLTKQVSRDKGILLNSPYQKQKTMQDQLQTQNNTKSSKVLSILYDDYLDCFAILTKQALTLIAANTGKVMHKIYPDKLGQCYVAMCLKQSRRLFLANNMGEIMCLKNQDCSILYKICPYLQSTTQQKPQPKSSKQSRPKTSSSSLLNSPSDSNNLITKPLQSQYFTYTIHYNSYNKVLIIIAQCQFHSILITYDNFSSFEPQKKKQIIFDQQGLISFVAASKFNMFYVASSRPDAVTIWDYHNFTILRTISINGPIFSITVESVKLNMLIIVEIYGVRLVKIAPIDAKNNARYPQNSAISQQLYIKHSKKIQKAQLVFLKSEGGKKPKKTKVTFHDQQLKVEKQAVDTNKFNKILNLFLISEQSLEIIDLQNCSIVSSQIAQPVHNEKPNITKQLKKISINSQSQQLPPAKQTLNISSGTKLNNINGFKKNVIILGKVNDLIYFQNDEGVLCLYQIQLGRSQAKLSLPKCQIIQWHLCYNLVSKIIARLKKAQQISKQIYAHKRKLRTDQKKNEYLRMCFLLNKYFTEDDMKDIRTYFTTTTDKSRKHIKLAQKPNEVAATVLEQSKPKQLSYFDQKYQEKTYNPNVKAAKLKQIQKRYSKAFSYIRKRQQSTAQAEDTPVHEKPTTTNTGLSEKVRSVSAHKLKQKTVPSFQNKMKNSTSLFKIRNTVSSANKMYFQHTKQIKSCLNKIGILNSKIKDLKL